MKVYIAIWWCVVNFTLIEVVLLRINQFWAIELFQNGTKRASIPVVCHSASVIALPCEVPQCNILHILHRHKIVPKTKPLGHIVANSRAVTKNQDCVVNKWINTKVLEVYLCIGNLLKYCRKQASICIGVRGQLYQHLLCYG